MAVPESIMKFFDACETGQGSTAASQYIVPGAQFTCQADALAEIKTVEAYTDWMKHVCENVAPGAKYELHNTLDDGGKQAVFFATFVGTHPPTGKTAHSHYVYVIDYNGEGKVTKMVKIWNDVAAFKMFGIA